jgi:RimJ/RimL family protein N-acetyltransferase
LAGKPSSEETRMSSDIPIVETERLTLRDHRLADFDAYVAMWADPIVTRFIGGRPRTREEAWIRLLRHAGMWRHMGFGFWAVEEKATGRFIGEAGFHELRRDLEPSIEGTLEAGWGFVTDAHGKGFATEAVGAAIAWGAANHNGELMTCIIDPSNTLSIRVAAKHGFRERVRTTYQGAPTIVFDRRPG